MDNSFTLIIKALRAERNISLRKAAERINVSAAYLSDIENAKTKPTAKLIESFSKEFNLSFDERRALEDAAGIIDDHIPFDIIKYLKKHKELLEPIIEEMRNDHNKSFK